MDHIYISMSINIDCILIFNGNALHFTVLEACSFIKLFIDIFSVLSQYFCCYKTAVSVLVHFSAFV